MLCLVFSNEATKNEYFKPKIFFHVFQISPKFRHSGIPTLFLGFLKVGNGVIDIEKRKKVHMCSIYMSYIGQIPWPRSSQLSSTM